ncbi:MAG: rhomboid family intramembrane serine protease [Phycisphaerales bacterium]|jgi:membrane associated rhomboid family serine protease
MIPLGTDRITRKTPTTITIVVLNIVIFLLISLGLNAQSTATASKAAEIEQFGVFYPGLQMVLTHPWTLVTYAFLHDPSGLSHVAFNMLFLWIFGRAVEDRLGSVWFAIFYISGAIVAALGEWFISPAPMIGASGAVAAATGAFAALCPRSRVRVLFFFTIIEIPGIVLVLIFVGLDLFGQLGQSVSSTSRGGIAYSAHLFGYAFGMLTMLALLGSGILKRTEFDLFFIMKQMKRRREMRAAVNQSRSPWVNDISTLSVATPQATPEALRAGIPMRRQLSDSDAKRELHDAGTRWSRGEFSAAANAWERFAQRFPSHPDSDGALLLAAVTYARKLNDPTRARELAQRLVDRVPAATIETLAQTKDLLKEIEGMKSQ